MIDPAYKFFLPPDMTDQPKRPERIALELPAPLREGLDELTRHTGRSRSEEIREAIRQHLRRELKRRKPDGFSPCAPTGAAGRRQTSPWSRPRSLWNALPRASHTA